MLVPVCGLVQVGLQPMADRFTYLPLIGIFLMLVWHIAGDRSQHPPSTIHHPASSIRPPSSILRSFSAVGAAVALLACAAATRHQLAYWQNAETLFAHVLRVTGPNYIALNNHGVALTQHGKLDEAIRDFELAVALDPALDAARFSLGQALLQQGKYDAAAEQFSTVLQLKPGHPAARLQLGLARARQGKYDEAIAAFSDALRLDHDFASVAVQREGHG